MPARIMPDWIRPVKDLQAGLPGWVDLPLQERIALLADVRRRVGKEAAGIVAASQEAQGLPAGSHWEGDVWFALSPWANQISALEVAMGRAAAGRDVVPPGAIHVRDDGRVVVDVFPVTLANRVFMLGYRGQVWLQPGVTPDQVRAEAGSGYRDGGAETAGVALLLAAGNLPCLPGMDALTLLFQRRCTVAMKLNPVNAYLRPFLERIFADFTAAGWLRFVDGGADVGQYLAHHPGIDRIHMTGSAATYNALVWGVGDQADHNRAAGTPLLSKPFDAELGGVNPLIVVPGKWGGQDIRRQADRIVFSRLFNSGHACTSTEYPGLGRGMGPGPSSSSTRSGT